MRLIREFLQYDKIFQLTRILVKKIINELSDITVLQKPDYQLKGKCYCHGWMDNKLTLASMRRENQPFVSLYFVIA